MGRNEQSITLLLKNKRDMVAALQANGYDVDETMRAADFPKYVIWGHGLLDLRVAAVRISNGEKYYFTVQEWNDLTNEKKDWFVKTGLRLRALSEDFIIAPSSFSNLNLAQARTRAASYKAHTAEDGVEDDNTWVVPNKNQIQIFYRYKSEIDNAFTAVWSSASALVNAIHWSNTLLSGSSYWVNNILSGMYYPQGDGSNATLRPVCNLKPQN